MSEFWYPGHTKQGWYHFDFLITKQKQHLKNDADHPENFLLYQKTKVEYAKADYVVSKMNAMEWCSVQNECHVMMYCQKWMPCNDAHCFFVSCIYQYLDVVSHIH